MWDWMDKQEGRKEGDSTRALDKEKKRQGYKSTPVRTKELEKKVISHKVKEKHEKDYNDRNRSWDPKNRFYGGGVGGNTI